ncbi:hypothetical protein PG995_006147 [Apiospora arundinis]
MPDRRYSRRHDASKDTPDVHIGPSSASKNNSHSYNPDVRWVCPRPRGAVTYPIAGKSHSYRRTTSRRAGLTGENQNDGIATPTNNAYPTLASTQPRPELFSTAFQSKDSLLTAQQSNTNDPLGTTQYASDPRVDWELHRYIVTQLYIIERLPLKNGAEPMRNEDQLYIIQLMFQENLWGSFMPGRQESLKILRFAEILSQALNWVRTFGLTQTPTSFAILTKYFGHHPAIVDPDVWVIVNGCYQAPRSAWHDTRLGDILIHFITQFMSFHTPHPFHDIYPTSRQRGSDELFELSRTVVGWYIVVTLSRYFPKEMVLKTIRDLSQDNARSYHVHSMPDSRAAVQRAFKKLAINEDLVETQVENAVHHLHQDKYLDDEIDFANFFSLLPEELRYDLQLENRLEYPCWTCIPPDTTPSYSVPLTIANLPVVIPIRSYYPLHAGLIPPPDPYPQQISPVGQLADEIVEKILETFEEAVGFYLLINGMLQIIVPEDFDITSALNHYPRRFGSLKVSFILQSQIPTAGEANKRRKISWNGWRNVGTSRNPSEPPTHAVSSGSGNRNHVSSNPIGPLPGPNLAIGSSVKAHVNKSNSQVRHHQAKLGLMTKRQDRVYLTLPTHLITQALTDSELDWNWPESGLQDVRLVAGDNDVDLGRIAKTFDTDARTFPDGFEHDVSLVDVSSLPETVTTGMRPGLVMDWLSVQGWSNLQLNTKNVFLLDDRDRTTKSIGIRDHQTQMVGQGILINRQKSKPRGLRNVFSFGRQNENVPSDIEACKRLVARSILYRVAQDYDAPDGQSGTPVCLLDEESEPGVQMGKVAGFTSYVQMVQDIQHYHIEGDQLANMLEHGRVAFYGAFKVPQEMREEHVII